MKPTSGDISREAAAGQMFREHLHRLFRQETHEQFQPNDAKLCLDPAFWPTERGYRVPRLLRIDRCQRCGIEIATSPCWWCRECKEVVWFLQEKGQTMVQIAASGEWVDGWEAREVDEALPWLRNVQVPTRVMSPRNGIMTPFMRRQGFKVEFECDKEDTED